MNPRERTGGGGLKRKRGAALRRRCHSSKNDNSYWVSIPIVVTDTYNNRRHEISLDEGGGLTFYFLKCAAVVLHQKPVVTNGSCSRNLGLSQQLVDGSKRLRARSRRRGQNRDGILDLAIRQRFRARRQLISDSVTD